MTIQVKLTLIHDDRKPWQKYSYCIQGLSEAQTLKFMKNFDDPGACVCYQDNMRIHKTIYTKEQILALLAEEKDEKQPEVPIEDLAAWLVLELAGLKDTETLAASNTYCRMLAEDYGWSLTDALYICYCAASAASNTVAQYRAEGLKQLQAEVLKMHARYKKDLISEDFI